MKRQMDKILPDRLRTEASKRLEEYITGIPDGRLIEDSDQPKQAEETEGKVNIYVNNRNKVRLTEKVLNTNEAAVNAIQEIVQSNNKVMEALDKGTHVTVKDSTIINNSGNTGFNIQTKQDSTARESYEYDLENDESIWLD